MALPDSVETPHTLALRKIVQETDIEDLLGWPKPSDDDYALFGKITHIYSGLDFILRYLAETMDKHGMFDKQWAGKIQKLTMAQVSEAIQSSAIWNASNRNALKEIDSRRGLRNLVAHFVVRRFPEDDAYIFMTKSAMDYRKVYGVLPHSIDEMLYAVLDAKRFGGIVEHLQELSRWAAQVLRDISTPIAIDGGNHSNERDFNKF